MEQVKMYSPETKNELVWTVYDPPKQKVAKPVELSDTDKVLALAKKHRWEEVRVCGKGPMLTKPTVEDGWTLIPISQDNSTIPITAWQRVRTIKAAGIPYKGLIIGHEPQPEFNGREQPSTQVNFGKLILILTAIAAVPVVVVAGLAIMAAMLIGAVILAIPLLILAAPLALLGVDPSMIMVMEDGTYIEIYWWNEEE